MELSTCPPVPSRAAHRAVTSSGNANRSPQCFSIMPPFLTASEPEPDLGWEDGGGRSVVEETRRQAATGALPMQRASQSRAI